MNPELRVTKLSEIDKSAEREKACVEYIVGLIDNDEEQMREVFLGDDERKFDELEIARLLYERVSATVESIRFDLVRTIGINIHRFSINNPPEQSAAAALGWETYGPPMLDDDEIEASSEKVYTHRKFPTEAGREVVDGLLEAQGYVSSREQAEINRKRWHDIISAPSGDI